MMHPFSPAIKDILIFLFIIFFICNEGHLVLIP